jgi:ABC-type transport system involved in multi-copper enzyme maturation permease subunit
MIAHTAMIASLARITVLEAVRNRLVWLAAIVIVMALGLAQFLNQVAIAESREIQAAVLAAVLRAAAVFIAAAFVVTSIVREWNDKVTELLLSLPAPRYAYFLGKFAGYAVLALILSPLSALPLILVSKHAGLVLWTFSLFCELLIVTAISMFCVLSLTQVVPAFVAVAGFYMLSRSMAAIQIIAGAPLHDVTLADQVAHAVVGLIAFVLPALDQMTETRWLTDPGLVAIGTAGTVLAQTAIYVALICAASLFDLYRKNF